MGNNGDKIDMSKALGDRLLGDGDDDEAWEYVLEQDELADEARDRVDETLDLGVCASGAKDSWTSWMTRRSSCMHSSDKAILRIDPSIRATVTARSGREKVTSSITWMGLAHCTWESCCLGRGLRRAKYVGGDGP